jgi:hypothetical protein
MKQEQSALYYADTWSFFVFGCAWRAIRTLPVHLMVLCWIAFGGVFGAALSTRLRSFAESSNLSPRAIEFTRLGSLIGGALIGVLLASAVTWAVLRILVRVFHPFPHCARNVCLSARDYGWNPGEIFGWEQGRIFVYSCRCGDRYLRLGRRFFILKLDEASENPEQQSAEAKEHIYPFVQRDESGEWTSDTCPVPQSLLESERSAWMRNKTGTGKASIKKL